MSYGCTHFLCNYMMSNQQVSDGYVDLSKCVPMGRIRGDHNLEVLNANFISRCNERHSQRYLSTLPSTLAVLSLAFLTSNAKMKSQANCESFQIQ